MSLFKRSAYIATARAVTKLKNEDGKQMLIAVAEMADEGGFVARANASAEKMAKRCGINEQTARKYLKNLRDENLIIVQHRKRKSYYKLADEEKLSKLI